MTKLYIVSKSEYKGKVIAIFRVDQDSYEMIIDNNNKIVKVWKSQYVKMQGGYEKEIYPKLVFEGKKTELCSKYNTPKDLIEDIHYNKY